MEDLEHVNDYLIQYATGKTREQIEQEVSQIKVRTSELKELNKLIETRQSKLDEINSNIDNQNKVLQVNDKNIKELEEAKRLWNLYSSQISPLRVEVDLLTHQLKSSTDDLDKMTKLKEDTTQLIQEEKQLKAELEKQQSKIIEDGKILDLKILKLQKIMEENQKAVSLLELNQKPAHFYIREIQKLLNKKQIDFDVIKELNIVV